MSKAPTPVIETLHTTVALLCGPAWLCERSTTVEKETDTSCIADEERRATDHATGARKGWHAYNPGKMCAACAAYWHVTCARNYALGIA